MNGFKISVKCTGTRYIPVYILVVRILAVAAASGSLFKLPQARLEVTLSGLSLGRWPATLLSLTAFVAQHTRYRLLHFDMGLPS